MNKEIKHNLILMAKCLFLSFMFVGIIALLFSFIVWDSITKNGIIIIIKTWIGLSIAFGIGAFIGHEDKNLEDSK